MRFRGLDLNLLIALDHLLTERNVSRAGEKLFRSQSTVSGALARLRDFFGDDLLVPSGRHLVPTPRGEELADAVRNVLLQIDATIMTRPDFDPASAERTVKIFASDYLMIAGLADALRDIQKEAPRLRFHVEQPSQQGSSAPPAKLLERGEVDLLAMPHMFVSPDHPHEPMFDESFCCIAAQDNARIGDRISSQEYLSLNHVVVSFGEANPSYETWYFKTFGNVRNIEVVAASFSTVPFLIVGTERIALIHRRLAATYAQMMPLRIVEPPFEVPRLTEAIQWHSYSNVDSGLLWIKDRLVSSLAR